VAFPSRIAISSRNPGKVREILRICGSWPCEWVTFDDASELERGAWPDVAETGATYLENALLKARALAKALGIAAVADDSGIEVDALAGGPGPRSARFAGEEATEEQNLRLLIRRIRSVPDTRRTARYRCVAVCGWPDDRESWAEGACEGSLILEPRGPGGFGYDPIFVPEGSTRTMAELADGEKDAVSHRGKAFRALGANVHGANVHGANVHGANVHGGNVQGSPPHG
jgi:XTP/dITP diphosphohydrolase